MGIFGKKTKTIKKEADVEKVEKTVEKKATTRRQILEEQRKTLSDLISDATHDLKCYLVTEGEVDEDMAKAYLVIKEYIKPIKKLIDLSYEEMYLEIEKTEQLEKAFETLAAQSAKQNDIIENQNKILDRMAKAIENANKTENLSSKKEK